MRSVVPASASASEARKHSFSPTPTMSGMPSRAPVLASDFFPADRGSEALDPRAAPHACDELFLDDRDAAGVVAAVLEPPQALDQDRNDVAPRRGADDAAHFASPSSSVASRTESTPVLRAPA